MKHWILYGLCALLSLTAVAVHASSTLQAEDGKRVLIINSYSKQMTWSSRLTDSLSARIYQQHPGWRIYTGNLNTDKSVASSAGAYTLRSILWGYAERTHTQVDATDLQYKSFFVQDDIPDLLVWVGEEGFMHYMSYMFQNGRWKNIPMVLCAVRDSVSMYGWTPERTFRTDRQYGIREYNTVTGVSPLNHPNLEILKKDKDLHFSTVEKGGKLICQIEARLNYSGVTVFTPVRKNLQLIRNLIPDIEELIWVDDNSYTSLKARLEVEAILDEELPGVKYAKMIHNRLNTDSIYDVMLQPAPHRAFLTFGWSIDGLYSKRSDRQLDSLFTNVSTVPLFSLAWRDFVDDNYWIGGHYPLHKEVIDKTVRLMERGLQGDSLMPIPFDTVQSHRLVLNRTAIERYGLTKEADKLEDVLYVHLPPTFLQKYERPLLLIGLILVLVLCYVVISIRRRRYNKRLQADFDRYKRLYDKLQVIYENCSTDFALYDGQGQRLLRIVNGEEAEAGDDGNDLFSENIFESSCLTDTQKHQIREGRVVNCEVQEIYQLIVKPLHEVDYPQASLIAIVIDLSPVIHERKEKEHFERLFRFAADSSQVGVVFYDVATAVGMATNSWSVALNETFTSGTYPTYSKVVAEDRAELLNYQLEVRAGRVPEPVCRDVRVLGDDGREHWVRQHMYFVRESGRLIELSLDIDQQKQGERALEEAKQRAEQSNEESRQFLSSISHEVRTPLNSIVGFSAVLAVADDEESEKEFAPIILRNLRLLDALITNILDLSTLDAGSVEFNYTRVNVADLFIEMEAYIRNNLYDRPLRVVRELPEYEEERIIYTDPEYLRLLLLNLISNAVKFTETGSITLGCRRELGEYYFYIKDTGCGIGAEDRKKIFNRFVKLNSYMQGTGLGLSLCKSIVEHLGGEIGVESELGKGSTFWFKLSEKRE